MIGTDLGRDLGNVRHEGLDRVVRRTVAVPGDGETTGWYQPLELDDGRSAIAGIDGQARHEGDSEPSCGETLDDFVVVRPEDDVRFEPGGSEAVQRRSDRQGRVPADER